MKQFEIFFRNLKNGSSLDTLFSAKNISEALADAERYCKKLEEHNIKLKVTAICEIN